MTLIEKALKKLAKFQYKYRKTLFIIIILLTIFLLMGVPKIRMQSDMSASMPQELPIYQLNDKVTAKFGGQDVILILIQIDDSSEIQNLPKDIRNHKIISYVSELTTSLESESSINSVTSIGTIFKNQNNLNQQTINYILEQNPALEYYFSDSYKSTFLMIQSNVGSSEKKVSEITELINSKIESFSKPAGTKISITGSPPMQITMLEILFNDATFTLLIACLLIFILLLILEKSLTKAILIFTPLAIALIFTLGTMGWLNIMINMATAGLGAMILGLGVEYGVFVLTRFQEERRKGNDLEKSLINALPSVGSAIVGSGLTTTFGFLALTMSFIPMMQDLGLSLALGILYCLISAIFIAPIIIILFEKAIYKIDKYLLKFFKHRVKEDKHGGC